MLKNRTTIEEFTRLATSSKYVAVCAEMAGDVETPVSLYLKLKTLSKESFLFESALQQGSSGRFSFIGIEPESTFSYADNILTEKSGSEIKRTNIDKPIEYLRTVINDRKIIANSKLSFSGGLVGYIGYDSIRLFEDIPDDNYDEIGCDDFRLMLCNTIIIYDHFTHTITISVICDTEKSTYNNTMKKLKSICKTIASKTQVPRLKLNENRHSKIELKPNIPKEEFCSNVIKAKEHILAGDIFQVVLSQRFSIDLECDSFSVYRVLRILNPSPYMFYLDLGEMTIAGSSPEVLVKMHDSLVSTRPLAGTRPRGATPDTDRQLAEELLADEKECAEHLMLVDLGRNDIGKFCRYGSVSVPEFMDIERYSHVMHIVSEVQGHLAVGSDIFDVFEGSFPAGTVSGAPKIKAMEIIDKLENCKRGVYAGAIGYFDFSENLDTCIAIRTIVFKNNRAYIQAGAGIVADSDPEKEYQETLNKARVLIEAVAQTEGKMYDPDNR